MEIVRTDEAEYGSGITEIYVSFLRGLMAGVTRRSEIANLLVWNWLNYPSTCYRL